MLQIYRRHSESCPHHREGRSYRRCRCSIWVQGTLGGKRIRRSMGERSWERAQSIVRKWEVERAISEGATPITVEAAATDFSDDLRRRDLARETVRKYGQLLRELRAFARESGIEYLDELDLPTLRKFCSGWTQGPHTALKKLERLRAFLGYAMDSKWIGENPARRIQNPKIRQTPTMPFTPQEVTKILAACWRSGGDPHRLRAFVLLLRYSGLRIGDAARLRKDAIEGDRLRLYVQKTGVPVALPLPAAVIEALAGFRSANETYYFWSGVSNRDGVARTWMKYMAKLFADAGIRNGHAHRFRDTFAVELLLRGGPIERVSVLLGHQGVKVTEKHYSPWVKARQEQLEADLRGTWGEDPILFAETKGTKLVQSESDRLN